MCAYTSILVRDSQSDTGITPSPGYPYTSPDIICTQQTTYANANTQFGNTASYNSNPGLNVIQGQNNNFYVRGMNLGPTALGGNMYVYWSKSSLLLTPNLWFNQPMISPMNGGANYVTLPAVGQNMVTVAQNCFSWTPPALGPSDHFCLVGAVSIPSMPWPPPVAPSFASIEDFILWVRNNQNICWRNLTVVTNPAIPQWDRVDGFSNPDTSAQGIMITVNGTNIPAGTTVKLLCTALGINDTYVVPSGGSSGLFIAQGAVCPGSFNGVVETSAYLPARTQWPAGAQLQTASWFTTAATSPIARFANDFGAQANHPGVIKALSHFQALNPGAGPGVLVEAGNTTTRYL